MKEPLGRLFFPLIALKLSKVLAAGNSILDLEVKKIGGHYVSRFFKDGKPLKLSLEKLDDTAFTEIFLDLYYFRQPDKEYNAARKLFARLGLHNRTPLAMEYSEQKYILKAIVKHGGVSSELQLFYSPVVGRLVARRI